MNNGFTYRERVSQEHAGSSLLAYLSRRFEHSSEDEWRARIHAGELAIDDTVVTNASLVLRAGLEVAWAKPPWVEPDAPLSDVRVLYEDQALLALHKPAGLPVLPGSGYLENTLLAWARAHSQSAAPAHRLGRGTSGLMLFTKDVDAARSVQKQWTKGTVEKHYRALVQGSLGQDELVVDAPIGLVPDTIVGELYAASPAGKRARSTFAVRERRANETVLDVLIETGRPHQIRIHAAFAGHPLVDDPLYGAGGVRRVDSSARPGDIGYHLHAHTLALTHPRTNARLLLEAPPPEKLA